MSELRLGEFEFEVLAQDREPLADERDQAVRPDQLYLADVELAGPTAWLFGPEAHGLPADVVDLATARVRIPMAGRAESLNVGSAAAICLYQSARASD